MVAIGALLVDDYAEIRMLMRMVLDSDGGGLFVAGEASSGDEALQLLDECDPAVVVLDQMMPGLTGLETAARLRARRPGLPVVVCTAYLDDSLRAEAHALGIVELLTKDELGKLPQAIRRAVRTTDAAS